nr:helix-turn-helix transcriptional regulator [Clostridia bacterium]
MSLNIVSLGRRIRLTRKKRGLSQNVLSEMIDKTPAFLSYIEGGSKCMSLDTFVDLVNALNTTADDLLRDSLNNTVIIIHNSFSELLSDCTQYEERVLLDTVIAVKETLRSNRNYLFRNTGKW